MHNSSVDIATTDTKHTGKAITASTSTACTMNHGQERNKGLFAELS